MKPKDILAVIDAARKYAVPAALKRALCALLLNPPVWERSLAGQPKPEPLDGGVEVPLSDVLMLYHARHVLQHEWNTPLFAVPGEAQSGRCFGQQVIGPEKCQLVEREARAGRWRTMFIDRGYWEKGL